MRVLRAWVLWTVTPLLMMAPSLAYSQTLSAMWDPNPSSDGIVGYEVCIGTTSQSCNFELATVAASENTYTFTPNPGVLYRVAVRAINAAGPGPYSAEVLTSVPGLTQPANQTSTVNVPISPVSLSAIDPDGGILQFSHSGLPFGLSLNQSTGIITGTPTSPGTFSVTIFVSDGTVTTSRTFVWTVNSGGGGDTTAPALSITSHTANQSVGTSTITLAGTATDGGAGGSGITTVTVNGAAATGGAANGSATANWSRSVTLSVGANTIAVAATDGAGNVRTASITITRTNPDMTAPTLSITSHTSGQTVTSTTITFSGTATDSGAGGSGIANVTVNGSAAAGGAASGNNTANWSRSISLSIGANTLTVVATDGAGNARTASISVTRTAPIDTTAPALSVTSHASGQTVSGSSITLVGTATDSGAGGNGIASVTVNGASAAGGAASGNGTASWNRTLTLAPGANVVTVVATDGAGNTRTMPITLVAPTSAASTTTLSANRTSPQPVGTTVTFSAGASGGVSPYSYKWWVKQNGGAWALAQDWSTSTTLTWTPSASGTYAIGVWARSNGVTADLPQTSAIGEFLVSGTSTPSSTPPPSTPPPSTSTPPTYVSIAGNQASPQPVGTTVTFSAGASGGASPYSYKWWVKQGGGAWTLAQDWSTSTTLTWTPSVSGTYAIGIWARSNGVTADLPQSSALAEFVVSGSPVSPPPPPSPVVNPPTSALIGVDRPGPQPTGTALTFSAAAFGGSSPYSYKWWVKQNGGAWTVLRDWSTSATLTFTPTTTGTYVIGIWARSNTVTADLPQTSAILEFSVR